MSEELTKKLLEQLRQLGGQGTDALAGWQTTKPAATTVQGVAVPVSVQTPIGKVRTYFLLGPEVATTPEALLAAIEQLYAAGIPIDAWQEGKSWSGQARGWNGSRGWRR